MKPLHAFLSFAVVSMLAGPGTALASARVRLPREFTFPRVTTSSVHANSARRRPAFATTADVGSAGDVTADPPVKRPSEAPCIATLFRGAMFAQYASQSFAYKPPAGCPGPYAKIVFNGDFSVSAGVQFDRTAAIELGNVPIYFGTTAEPDSDYAPTWHVERDVTDDAALLAAPQSGEADIYNIVDSTYTGIISGTTYLQFYPARGTYAAADTPDIVLPLPGVAGGPQHVDTGAETLSATYTLPQNVDRAYLDLYAQGQQNDEFYYTCAPSNVASEIFDCPNGPLRETEVSIDGIPAGTAPVTPWIFTGGIDPYLWAPIPGAETLEFKPYRVDLTPFAGVLSNGKPHVIAIAVDNADSYFQGIATLFAYRDKSVSRVTGAVTRDTLVANPPATVSEHLTGSAPSITGSITVTSRRDYQIDGYVTSAAGRTDTYLTSSLSFANKQTLSNESATTGTTTIAQATTAETLVTTIGHGARFDHTYVSFPLNLTIATALDDTGTGTQTTTVDQHFLRSSLGFGARGLTAQASSNEVKATDSLDILDDEFITGNSGMSSSQHYDAADVRGPCYSQTILAANSLVTSVANAPCGRADASPALLQSMSQRRR